MLVKIGMDNWLLPAIFADSFSTFSDLTDSRGLLERINNYYYCYWEPGSSQFRVQHDIAIILRNPSIRFNASLAYMSNTLDLVFTRKQIESDRDRKRKWVHGAWSVAPEVMGDRSEGWKCGQTDSIGSDGVRLPTFLTPSLTILCYIFISLSGTDFGWVWLLMAFVHRTQFGCIGQPPS